MAEPKKGEWHRVMLNTIVRKGVALDSERLRILPMGSRVFVTSRLDRRVEITEPIHGWCSMKSSNGDTILMPVQDGTPGGKGVPATPSANSNVAAKFSTFQARAQAAQLNVEKEEAKINQWSSNLSEESRKRVQDLAKISEKKALEEKLSLLTTELQASDNSPENNERIRDLTAALRDHAEAAHKKRVFEQMGEAAANEIENIKKQYADYFGHAMRAEKDESKLYPRDVVRFLGEFGEGLGIVRFFGEIEGLNMVGLEFAGDEGDSNGSHNGVQYFSSKDNHALFLPFPHERILGRIEAGNLLTKLNDICLRVAQIQSSKE